VSGDSGPVHRFDALEASTVHGVCERTGDSPQPVGLQGFELLFRGPSRRASRFIWSTSTARSAQLVCGAGNSAERDSGEAVIQALDHRFGSVAEVRCRWGRGLSVGEAFKADRTDRHLSTVDCYDRSRYPASGRAATLPEIAHLKRCVLTVDQDRNRRPFHLDWARNWTAPLLTRVIRFTLGRPETRSWEPTDGSARTGRHRRGGAM
jgi:hypothetical protein